MALQVDDAGAERVDVVCVELVCGCSPVVFHGADGGHDHGCGDVEATVAGLDVEEFFRSQIGAESGFGQHEVGVFEGDSRAQQRAAAVGDVGEGAAVAQRGGPAQGLDEIGVDRVFEQGGQCPGRP